MAKDTIKKTETPETPENEANGTVTRHVTSHGNNAPASGEKPREPASPAKQKKLPSDLVELRSYVSRAEAAEMLGLSLECGPVPTDPTAPPPEDNPPANEPVSTAQRKREHRQRLTAAGLREFQVVGPADPTAAVVVRAIAGQIHRTEATEAIARWAPAARGAQDQASTEDIPTTAFDNVAAAVVGVLVAVLSGRMSVHTLVRIGNDPSLLASLDNLPADFVPLFGSDPAFRRIVVQLVENPEAARQAADFVSLASRDPGSAKVARWLLAGHGAPEDRAVAVDYVLKSVPPAVLVEALVRRRDLRRLLVTLVRSDIVPEGLRNMLRRASRLQKNAPLVGVVDAALADRDLADHLVKVAAAWPRRQGTFVPGATPETRSNARRDRTREKKRDRPVGTMSRLKGWLRFPWRFRKTG